MKKHFTTYEIALELKELGFNEPCFGYFNDTNTDPEISLPVAVDVVCLKFNLVKAPIWQQAIDFLWTEKGILVNRNLSSEGTMYWQCGYNVFTEDELELAILKAIEISKNNK